MPNCLTRLARFRATLILILSAFLVRLSGFEAALPSLPSNLNVESEFILIATKAQTGQVVELFHVEEFISREEGSIKLTVRNVTESNRGHDEQDYFRLLENGSGEKLGNELVAYEVDSNRCRKEQTSTWQLREFTRILDDLYQTSEESLRSEALESDRTCIGTAALLRLVHENAEKFVLESKAFDEYHLTDAYYFVHRFRVDSNRREAKIIVLVSKQHIDVEAHDGDLLDKLKIGQTRLAELRALSHLTAIGYVTANAQGDERAHLDMRAPELLDFNANVPPQDGLLVSYQLIEERSFSRHLGGGSMLDLFSLPPGVGCGHVSAHRPVYLTARQFSGKFESLDHSEEHFVAYDEASQHFRLDSGPRKLIYSLGEKLATLVSAEPLGGHARPVSEPQMTHKRGNNSGFDEYSSRQEQVAASNMVHEYQSHCAQTSLLDEKELASLEGMRNVLGAGGDRVGLMYLGQKRLDPRDELSMRVHVFEREISDSHVPLLARLNLRHRLRMDGRNQYSMVFYFVDEAGESGRGSGMAANRLFATTEYQTPGEAPAFHDSMWLKRVELLSHSNLMKYANVDSRMTFSRFSWSLESIAEETRDRNSKLMHPERTFDTLECWPARGYTQLSLAMNLEPISHVQMLEAGGELKTVAQMESLEESLLQFVAQQAGFPRSQVNDFDLVEGDASPPAIAATNFTKDTPTHLLVRAKLTLPFDYYFNSKYLVGWIKSLPVAVRAGQAELVFAKFQVAYHECALALAVRLANSNRGSFYMLACPLVGCAHLKVDKLDAGGDAAQPPVDYVKANPAASSEPPGVTPDVYSEMCEIHLIRKRFSSTALVSDRFKSDTIKKKLESVRLAFKSAFESLEGAPSNWQRGHVTQVLVGTSSEAQMRDEQLLEGLCYGLETKLSRRVLATGNESVPLVQRFVQFDLDKHHSRIHCHRACEFYQFCETYSFNLARRQCTLSDVTAEQVRDPLVQMDQNKPYDCTIHAINPLGMYRRRPYIMFNRPMDLIARHNLLLGLSMSDCARFCRHNELLVGPPPSNETGSRARSLAGCQSFSYMRLRSLCILDPMTKVAVWVERPDDAKRVPVLENTEALVEYFGGPASANLVSESEPHEAYERDFTQHFSVRQAAHLELRQPEGTAQVDRSVATEMRGLDLMECARECTIAKRFCVTFDHCANMIKGIYTNRCHLYDIRSPLTIPDLDRSCSPSNFKVSSDQFEAKLTILEAYFYIANRSSEHEASLDTTASHCRHYYLSGDSLYLKRRLSVASRNYSSEDKLIEQLDRELELKSERTPASPKNGTSMLYGSQQANDTTTGGGVFKSQMLAQVVLGILLGALVFVVQPKIVQLAAGSSLLQAVEELWHKRRARNERSMSQVEITEMVDIGG